MRETIDTSSPERAWSPFMEWLQEHDLDPNNVYAVELGDGEDPRCVAYCYAIDADGQHFYDEAAEDVARCSPLSFFAKRPAPRRLFTRSAP